jgi:sialate O-acetylesterase
MIREFMLNKLARFIILLFLMTPGSASAEFKVHPIFSDGMVLQRDKPIRIFGFAPSGHVLTVTMGDHTGSSTANDDGRWWVTLDPMASGAKPHQIRIKDASSGETVMINEVLLGDVWILGGQSNMEHAIHSVQDGDLEVLSAHYPQVRLLTIPQGAGPEKRTYFEPLDEFNSWNGVSEWKGRWEACTPESVRQFSAIGYVFGRRLHQVGQIPVGLIDTSRGGTTVEAWTSRASLEKIEDGAQLVTLWDQRASAFDPADDLKQQMKNWERHAEQQRKQGKEPRPKPTTPRQGPAFDQNRPANCYNQMLLPLEGLAIRGVIWNQGYNNALGDARPRLYNEVFQTMIRDWRAVFRDEALPFGIVGLTAGGRAQTRDHFEIRMVDPAPYIREAQFRAAREMQHVAYVASWDQQMAWYHPFKKVELGERMARWAITSTLGIQVPWKSPVCMKQERVGKKIVMTFDREVKTHDGRDFEGFAIAGEDRRFYPADGKWLITGKDDRGREQIDRRRVTVSHPLVSHPVAVRYAWARNPLGNGVLWEHHGRTIPIPGFRTDTWDYPEAPLVPSGHPSMNAHRLEVKRQREQAEAWARDRKQAEARWILEQAQELRPQ